MKNQLLNYIKNNKVMLALFLITIFCLSCNSYHYVLFQSTVVNFADLILTQTNDINTVNFALLFAFLIAGGGVSAVKFKHNSNKTIAINGMAFCISLSAMLCILFILINYIVYTILAFGNYSFGGLAISLGYFTNQTTSYTINSLVLNMLRYAAIFYFIFLINTKFKSLLGIIIIIILSPIEIIMYFAFGIYKPLYIVPLEHSLVTYTSTELFMNQRAPFLASYFYWGIVFLLITVIYIYAKTKTERAESKNETST